MYTKLSIPVLPYTKKHRQNYLNLKFALSQCKFCIKLHYESASTQSRSLSNEKRFVIVADIRPMAETQQLCTLFARKQSFAIKNLPNITFYTHQHAAILELKCNLLSIHQKTINLYYNSQNQ